jgi:hypothetical protein
MLEDVTSLQMSQGHVEPVNGVPAVRGVTITMFTDLPQGRASRADARDFCALVMQALDRAGIIETVASVEFVAADGTDLRSVRAGGSC